VGSRGLWEDRERGAMGEKGRENTRGRQCPLGAVVVNSRGSGQFSTAAAELFFHIAFWRSRDTSPRLIKSLPDTTRNTLRYSLLAPKKQWSTCSRDLIATYQSEAKRSSWGRLQFSNSLFPLKPSLISSYLHWHVH
jgi:hypothetical protein